MKLLNLSLIALLIFLASCKVQFATVKVDYNPSISFKPDSTKPDPTTIVLINQFDLTKVKIKDPKKIAIIKTGAFIAIRYAETNLRQLHNVNVINIADSAGLKVNTDSIKFLVSKYHADYVLALANFNADVDLTDLKSTGNSYSVKTTVSFILNESNGIFYKRLNGGYDDQHNEADEYAALAALIFNPTIKGNRESVKAGAQLATDDALHDYLHHSVTHNRPLDAISELQPAIKELLAHNYTKADSLLQPFLTDKDPIMASKAAYTLAIVYEAGGYIDLATQEAQAALTKWKGNYFAIKLLNDLQEE